MCYLLFSISIRKFDFHVTLSRICTGLFAPQFVSFIQSRVLDEKSSDCSKKLWFAGFINISHISTVRQIHGYHKNLYKFPLYAYNNRIKLYLYIFTDSMLSLLLCTHSHTHKRITSSSSSSSLLEYCTQSGFPTLVFHGQKKNLEQINV